MAKITKTHGDRLEDRLKEYTSMFPIVNFCERMNLLMSGKIKKIGKDDLHEFSNEFDRDINSDEKTAKQYDYIIKNLNPITEYKYFKIITDKMLEWNSVCYLLRDNKEIDLDKRKRYTFMFFIDCITPDKRVEFFKKYLLESSDIEDFEHIIFDKFQKEIIQNKKLIYHRYPLYYDILKEVTITKDEFYKKLKKKVYAFSHLIDGHEKICKVVAKHFGLTFKEFKSFVKSNLNKEYM